MNIKYEQQKLWSNIDHAERYWSLERPRKRRKWFANSVLKKYEFGSIYEAGCNSGRNLWYVENKISGKKLGGLDINERAIEMARRELPHAELECASIYDINVNDKYDIVFTSGTLLHIPPREIKSVIESFTKKATKWVMHLETQGKDCIINGPAEFNPIKKVSKKLRCVHNYRRIYAEIGYSVKVKTTPMGESDARHLIIVEI